MVLEGQINGWSQPEGGGVRKAPQSRPEPLRGSLLNNRFVTGEEGEYMEVFHPYEGLAGPDQHGHLAG